MKHEIDSSQPRQHKQTHSISCSIQTRTHASNHTTSSQIKAERRSRGEGLTKDELKKKNATILCLYGLYKMKKIEDTKDSIKVVLGGLNVASFYFPGQVGDLHKGTANVQCFNAIVY
jgi:hypothetical protein